ncbi:hypothetical protein LAZ67_16002340 [Cordylochernes scorpioides]|uniref:Integrase catalytic domain-containing protein n=1 Tax=Cordylochernes scorpioides TaxID=51811 RepID=A0ABY6LC01_9ARAC|nr:hypothetical protein LAZ67_16002340 [Cordylochernes scorpioides]
MASLPSHDVTLNKLDGYNYSLWSFKIEMLLQKEDLWEVVTENIPDEPKIEWKKKDSKARAIINLSIADSQIVHVKNLLTAKATWDTLKNIYERKTLSGKIYLLRKLYSLKLEEDKDMQQHITTMMELVDKLRTIGETLKDSHITAILLCSLPKSYSNLITIVESSKDESTASKALKSLHRASSQRREKEKKFCSFCHKPNHSKEECWHYQKRNNSNKEYKYENFRRGNVPKYTNQSSVTQEQSTNQRTTKGPNPKALNCTQREASVHNWFVDSGATSHMAYDESFFTELNREQTQNVVVANGNKLQVKGIGQGEIKVITPQGKTDTLLLTKVLYIQELTDNLLSVSAATSNGCKVTFNRDWCTIERDNTALANGILDNGMYRLHLDDNPQTRTFKANVAKQNHCKNKNCLMLWHDRLGHRNIESIKKIRNENLARGLSLNNCSHSTDCVQCIQGKLTETPFPKKTEYRATETLQLVHSDICGPLPTNSLSGKRYFITFTDDYSRYTKIYLLKGKDEAYEKIKDYVISAHTEFGKNIQTIRTDNGREYVNRQVEDFLNQSGIKHQLTVPYSPAQNGVAERKNRSLMEMTRCMLFDSGLPQSLWAEAVTTANYLHNRIPSKATDKTPFELWTNRKPSLKHLKRFGCKAFAYIPKIKRNKLDSKVIEGIFLGYDDRSKGYRILHDTDNITISRSVKFIEKENGFHHASTKTTSPQVLSTDLTSSNHIGNAEESQEPGTQSENLEDSETEDYIQLGTSTGTQVVTQRRSTRPTKGIPPIRNDYMLYKTEAQDIPTPTSYSEVLQLPKIEREKWLQAMNEELNSLEKNNVWELTPLPKDKKIIGCKWTYKQKLNSKGEIERYKARLVAKGFNQKFGRDYEETFAPIVKHSTIRAFLAASVYKGMKVNHLDVKTAFLHGDLDKELYMELPEGLHTKQTNKVCKLKKAIYGLKQAGRSWNTKIASTLIKNNFKQSIVDPCLFTKNEENHSIYLILYVDDMLLASDSEIIIQNTVKTLEKEFEIKNLGYPTQFIGIEISRNREGELLLSQKNKIQELVERYNLQEAKPTFTPMESGYPGISDEKLLPNNVQYQQLIGSLLYLSVVSRPDIAAPVCILSSRNQNPRNCDWNAAKRIVRYLKTTKELELRISNQKPPTLEAYSDATWANDNTDRKSLSGNLFLLGSNPISWMTGKQGCVSLSSTEAELISAAEASQELLWLLDLLKDLELEQKAPIYFHQDNQSCLKICSSEKVSSRTKHIATKIHHLKDLQKKTVIKMVYCPTGDMKADILTKPLPRPTFEKLRYNLVIVACWFAVVVATMIRVVSGVELRLHKRTRHIRCHNGDGERYKNVLWSVVRKFVLVDVAMVTSLVLVGEGVREEKFSSSVVVATMIRVVSGVELRLHKRTRHIRCHHGDGERFYTELLATSPPVKYDWPIRVILMPDDELMAEISLSKITGEIAHLKRNKACGLDNIPNEAIKALPPAYQAALYYKGKALASSGAVWPILTRSKMNSFKSSMKLLDAMVLSTLLYAAPVWANEHTLIVDQIQDSFMRKYLNLPRYTPGYLLMIELGRVSHSVTVLKLTLKFWLRILGMGETRLPLLCLSQLWEISSATKEYIGFTGSVVNILNTTGFQWVNFCTDYRKLQREIPYIIRTAIEQSLQKDHTRILNSRLYPHYKNICSTPLPEHYLSSEFPLRDKRCIAGLRILPVLFTDDHPRIFKTDGWTCEICGTRMEPGLHHHLLSCIGLKDEREVLLSEIGLEGISLELLLNEVEKQSWSFSVVQILEDG